jgi:hypothetical protein
MAFACDLPWIRSACRSRGFIAWKLGLANRVLWPLRNFFWDIYLCGCTSEPIGMVGLEGPIKVLAFFRKFPEVFSFGLALNSEET